MKKYFLLLIILTTVSTISPASDLRVIVPNPIAETNPLKTKTAQEHFVLGLIYEYLFTSGPDGQLIPTLVEDWSFDKIKKTLSLKIRRQHFFSDGVQLKADHIRIALQKICETPGRGPDFLLGLEDCGIKKDLGRAVNIMGEFEIELKISIQPSAFLYRLSAVQIPMFYINNLGEYLGSGPYKISRLKGGQLTLVKNAFAKDRGIASAKFDSMDFNYQPELTLNVRLVKDPKTFDIAAMYLSSSADSLPKSSFKTIYHAPLVTSTLVLNPLKKPLDQKLIRQQLNYLLTKVLKVDECYSHVGKPFGFVPPGIGGSLDNDIEELNRTVYRNHNVQVKIKDAESITIFRHSDRANKCEENRITQAFKTLGMVAVFKHIDKYQEIFPKYTDPNTQAYLELFVFWNRDATSVLRRFSTQSLENFYFFQSKSVDTLLLKAFALPSLSDRFATYRQINNLVSSNSTIVPLYYVGHFNLISPCFQIRKNEELFLTANSFIYLNNLIPVPNCRLK